MEPLRITSEAMDTDRDDQVSTVTSLPTREDTLMLSSGTPERVGSPYPQALRHVHKGVGGIGKRSSPRPTPKASANLELHQLAAKIGAVMGKFD